MHAYIAIDTPQIPPKAEGTAQLLVKIEQCLLQCMHVGLVVIASGGI